MPVVKIEESGVANAMITDEGGDSIDTFIRQAIGKEPILSFPRTGDSPVQWIQLLNALDQQDLPGWPLLTPLKVQMQKCDKCPREFCSPINYRRHIRMHRRSLNVDKESHKNRDLLGKFWDTLSLEDAKEVVSFDDVSLKEVSGSSVVQALASALLKPGVWTLPQVYVKAGSILLDIVEAKSSSRLPISSPELFSILDDASEKTFLCAGTAESIQRYVIGGEADKALELKNLVACASLLFELKLVKAWLADKDVEALRCQKLLVEEEEAAQQRQAKLLERKKQRKLRKMEQKERELFSGEKADTSDDSVDEPVLTEMPIPQVPTDVIANGADTPSLELIQVSTEENYEEDIEAQFSPTIHSSAQNVEEESVVELTNGRRNRWQVPKSHRNGRNGFHGNNNHNNNQHLQGFKFEPVKKQSSAKDRNTLVNGGKVWTVKSKVGNDKETPKPKLEKVTTNEMDDNNHCEVMIGSISVPVKHCSMNHQERFIPKKDKLVESETVTKVWKPVSQSEPRVETPVKIVENDVTVQKVEDRTTSGEICLQSSGVDKIENHSLPIAQGNGLPEVISYSKVAAKAFLEQRWKEAISGDHVTLVLTPKTESAEPEAVAVDVAPSVNNNHVGDPVTVTSSKRKAKSKIKMKHEKGVNKIKYIPKQKVAT